MKQFLHFAIKNSFDGTSQSLEPMICQQLSCGYCCFMGLHVSYNLSHRYDALLSVENIAL